MSGREVLAEFRLTFDRRIPTHPWRIVIERVSRWRLEVCWCRDPDYAGRRFHVVLRRRDGGIGRLLWRTWH